MHLRPSQWKGSDALGLFSFRKKSDAPAACSAQTAALSVHPFYRLGSFYPLGAKGRISLAVREAVPIVDAALNKLVRLTDGFSFETGNDSADRFLEKSLAMINVGGNQQGISQFASNYLNQLLTFGTAIGEVVLCENGIYALYNTDLSYVELKRAENGIDVEFYASGKRVNNEQLIFYSVLNPRPDELVGTSILDGLSFVSDILMKIYNTIGENWEHAGNIRYAVTCKNTGEDGAQAKERAGEIAEAWSDAMSSDSVKDFVAVGDVNVSVIGADNKVLDSEIPVRQLLEQIVAKTGLPPFMLGLNWSSTERMSKQQADILTTELESYRRILSPVLKKIADLQLALNGFNCEAQLVWDDITLQDECEQARAELYRAQAEKIRGEESR